MPKKNNVLEAPRGELDPDPQDWIKKVRFKTTENVDVPTRLIDQVLGQDDAVAVARKAAEQHRNLMLIGDPGTGKSMLAKAMAEILPNEQQNDLIAYHNPKNPNQPRVTQVEGGTGRELVHTYEKKAKRMFMVWRVMEYVVAAAALGFALYLKFWLNEGWTTFILIIAIALIFLWASSQRRPKGEQMVPKLLLEHDEARETAPYVDATGSQSGALLGDVRHDPYQAGGLETPSHQRVELGAIHRAHKGILFIDEINTLKLGSQQALLTAMQDGEYAIAGQSQASAGAMVQTERVPCHFILVAAGNLDAVMRPEDSLTGDTGMHPALRSRIRGYGYEVYVNSMMDDTHENRLKLIQFVAQEVTRDGKIPHFEPAAVADIIREGQRRSGQTGKLTLRLRELGGLVRTAGDFARAEKAKAVTREHVQRAKGSSRSLEQQIADQEIKRRLSNVDLVLDGTVIGQANGGGSVGTGEVGEPAGLVIPVEAAVVPAISRHVGSISLGTGIQAARHGGIENVGPVLKRLEGESMADHDVHLDARINHPDAEAHGIGIAAAVASISALESIGVKQEFVIIGAIAVDGSLRTVSAMLQQVEAAMALGYKRAILPAAAERSVLLDDHVKKGIDVHYCSGLGEVLELVLDASKAEKRAILERLLPSRNGRRTTTATIKR